MKSSGSCTTNVCSSLKCVSVIPDTMNSVLLQVYVAMLLVTLLAAGITYAKILVVEAIQVCLCFKVYYKLTFNSAQLLKGY